MRSREYDLTQGGILNKLLFIALPIMGTQFLQMTYNLTDMFWLGRLSHEAVAATGSAGIYMWLAAGLMLIGQTGAGIGVAQSFGRKDTEGAQKYAQTSLSLSFFLGLSFAVLLILFHKPLIAFFNILEPNVVASAEIYLIIVAIGVPFTFVTAVGASCFNSAGNSRIPFYINFVGLVTNMVLDPLMIITWGWGVPGAGIATVCGQTISFLLTIWALKCSHKRPFEHIKLLTKPIASLSKQIFTWSIPVALESMSFTLLSMPIARMVAAWGSGAIAVQRVGSQIESLSWLISGGFAMALTSFVGQNYGAGCWKRIHKGFKLSTIAMSVWGLIVCFILIFGGRFLFTLFLPDPSTVDAGVTYLRILVLCQIPLCLENIAIGHFRGIGQTLPPSVASITSNALRIPLAFALSRTALDLNGIWIGITIGAVVRGLWLFFWYMWRMRNAPKDDVVAC